MFIHSFSYEKTIVHVTAVTKFVLKSLRTFVCPNEELLTKKIFSSLGIDLLHLAQ